MHQELLEHCSCAWRLYSVSGRIRILDDYTRCKAHISAGTCFLKSLCCLKCDDRENVTVWRRLKAHKNSLINLKKKHKDRATDVGINAFHGLNNLTPMLCSGVRLDIHSWCQLHQLWENGFVKGAIKGATVFIFHLTLTGGKKRESADRGEKRHVMNTQLHRAFKVSKSVGSEINWSVHNDGVGEERR